jgi:hypothetical protein
MQNMQSLAKSKNAVLSDMRPIVKGTNSKRRDVFFVDELYVLLFYSKI